MAGVRWAFLHETVDLLLPLQQLFPDHDIPGDAEVVGILLESQSFQLVEFGGSAPTILAEDEEP